ncbi:type VI secretion system-associated FHA domain protein TagH [Affinibrenneria salicis]|uniref:Type VI secretion system-associated FHA domain protein TagH n=1 Tax=Affinibrenneria salicis TaxID=2590031 RepID=A0A5J5FX13_9GAMM|nr:type VI secretion system-associated FHA domain protein TagH [Affinibrenneria salicis]KAA8998170.1 type VI secretion system-associated FHA domain protein TagH [Affinibrenneria salicis]
MRFTIIKSKSGEQPPQMSCDFLAPGGTIGRSVDNNLVLPDDDRAISRLQAIVHISSNGECHITNRGNVTLVMLNDIPLERGRQVELQEGDILGIGDYQLQLSDQQLTAQPPAASVQATRNVAAPQPAPAPAPVEPAANNGSTAIPSEIWDSLAQEFSIDIPVTKRAPVFNDAAHPLTEAPLAQEINPADPLKQIETPADLQQFQRRETDPAELFKEDPTFQRENILQDATPSTLLAGQNSARPADSGSKNSKDELDPLALFGNGGGETIGNDDPLGILTDNAVPLSQPNAPAAQTEHPSTPTEPAASEPLPPLDMPRPEEPIEDIIPERVQHSAPAQDLAPYPDPVEPPRAAAQEPARQTEPEPEPIHSELQPDITPADEDYPDFIEEDAGAAPYGKAPAMPARGSSRSSARLGIDPVDYTRPGQQPQIHDTEMLGGELLQALLAGIGLNDMSPSPKFDKAQMQQLGRLLSLFSQGTVALLSSRSILKRGVKAEMTMILDEANNPFKLLPSGKTVLMQMFGSHMPGFMPPEQAVRDALIDLQAHQLGMIAGIRAIIAAMLQSFNPERLEEEARREGSTSRLSLPGSRKAALWDHFVKSYQKTTGEIEDDFHTLFGEAFLHAYDVEVNQYKDSQANPE